jgi:hypothetical protein
MGDLASRIIGAESGGNPLARNPRSSAAGLGQFIDSTWLATIKKHRPDLAQGKTPAQLLQLKFDPAVSREMTSAYASDNQGFLRGRGIDPTPGNTYLAHFAGPQGAAAIHGNPDASAEQLLGSRAVAANPFLRGKTGADVIGWAAGKVDGQAPADVSQNNGGPMPGPIGGAPIAGGPVPLTAPNTRYSKLADALLASAAGAKPKGWGDLLNATGDLALGYTLANRADEEQKGYKSQLAERLLATEDNDAMAATLMSTGDDDLVKQGVALKVAQAKPQGPRFIPTPRGIFDVTAQKYVPGTEITPDDKPIEINGRLVRRNPQTNQYDEVYAAPPQAKPPVLSEIYDDTGRKQKAVVNLDSAEYTPIGGAAPLDAEKAAKLGLKPEAYTDKDGNLVYTQISEVGGRKDIELPEGARWAPGYDMRDTGTALTGFNRKSGEVGPVVPKDIAGKEAAQERGKAAGQAQAGLPAVKTTVENAFKTIGELERHPGIDTGTGLSSWLHPAAWTAGTDAYNFNVKNRKAQAQSFMGARDALKGAGQVTDFEGARGEAAIAAIETAQSKEQYLQELANLKRMMQASYTDMQRKAGLADQPTPVRTQTIDPATGQPGPAGASGGPARIQTQQEYQALPPGTPYVAPDGSIRTKQ